MIKISNLFVRIIVSILQLIYIMLGLGKYPKLYVD